jgi:hypothetical protein
MHTMTAFETTPALDWDALVVPLTHDEIMEAVRDAAWQRLRVSLKGETLETRYKRLTTWVEDHKWPTCETRRRAVVQVANYVNALKRGGMIR